MATIRLATITQGAAQGWTVVSPDRVVGWGKDERTYRCGSCDGLVAAGLLARRLMQTAIRCPHCGTLNAL